MCTGSFVKTLIAQFIYLMLCGIRLIPHGTRLARVCIFRHTSASSCHGLISYGTRRPRVCGIPYVSATRVPAGDTLGTHEGRVCRPPANWGQVCTDKVPPGTRLPRVSCNRANSAQVCTGTQRRPYSRGPSLRIRCKLGAGVYRRPSPAYSWVPSLRRPCKLAAEVYRRVGRRQTWQLQSRGLHGWGRASAAELAQAIDSMGQSPGASAPVPQVPYHMLRCLMPQPRERGRNGTSEHGK